MGGILCAPLVLPYDRVQTRTSGIRLVLHPIASKLAENWQTLATAYLENGGTIENAQVIAAHESPRTTKLYDHSGDEITLDEVERIGI